MKDNRAVKCLLVIILLIVAVLGLVAFNNCYNEEHAKTEHVIEYSDVSYTSFLKLMNNHDITSVTFNQSSNIFYAIGKNGINYKTNQLVGDNDIIKYAELNNIDLKVNNAYSQKDSLIMNLIYSIAPALLLIGFLFFIRNSQNKGMSGNKFVQKNQAKAVNYETIKTRLSDVAGCEEAKQEVAELIDFLKHPGKYRKIGARIPKGVIMSGPPGTGKTLMAKAVAGEAGVPFFSVTGSDFVEMYVGVGAQRVRNLFEQAKAVAPCIIFIDEIDAVGRKRSTGGSQGNEEREQTLVSLLAEMDGFEKDTGIIVMAATNRIDVLDDALIRPGRFDREVAVGYADVKGREQILKVHAKNVNLDKDVDLYKIALATSGFSGAELENLINESALFAARENLEVIGNKHFHLAKDKMLMGYEKKNMLMSDKNRKLIAYHEAGHTIVALFDKHAEPFEKVTIIPRGKSMGVTIQSPVEDRFGYTQNELLTMITLLFGGIVAEEHFLGEISTGASNDIERATSIVRDMVTKYGMSTLGPIHYGNKSGSGFKGDHSAGSSNGASHLLGSEIDEEVKRIISEQYMKAKELMVKHEKDVVLIAEELLIKESINDTEIRILLGLENEIKEVKQVEDDKTVKEIVYPELPNTDFNREGDQGELALN